MNARATALPNDADFELSAADMAALDGLTEPGRSE